MKYNKNKEAFFIMLNKEVKKIKSNNNILFFLLNKKR